MVVDVATAGPGVYREDVFPTPAPAFRTGIPVFLGYADGGPETPQRLTLWPQFAQTYGPPNPFGYLGEAVRGFFENDGRTCYVQRLPRTSHSWGILDRIADLRAGLARLDGLHDHDLLAVPDIMCTGRSGVRPDPEVVAAIQQEVLRHCGQQHTRCFALLDAVPDGLDAQHDAFGRGNPVGLDAGALYHPWVRVPDRPGDPHPRYVPPCGHVAGVYSRSDRAFGYHKAPANEELAGVLDLQSDLTEAEVGRRSAQGVNCLRALPGRGIRVWGARTLSADPTWRYVNVRRVFLAIGRWVQDYMGGLAFEPNDVRLWVRVMRDLTAFLDGLHQRGALQGRSAEDAFSVRCDSRTNPPSSIENGDLVVEVGVAVAAPAELVVARVVHGTGGASITTG